MSYTSFSKVTHCIFDLDGLLLDTEELYLQATLMIMDEYEKEYTLDVHQKCMNMTPSQACRFLIKHYSLPITLSQYYRLQDEYTIMLMQNTQLMPGAERLLQHLAEFKIPIAVVTSAPYCLFELKIKPHQKLFKRVHHVVCADSDRQVKRDRPHPDIYQVAASRFPSKPEPSECLVFEDSPNGMNGALEAGMQVVMVPNIRVPLKVGRRATQCLGSLEEFKPNQFGLPTFKKSSYPRSLSQ